MKPTLHIMKRVFLVVVLTAGVAGWPAAAAPWDVAGFHPGMQAQRGRPVQGPGPGFERGPGPGFERPDRGREMRYERRDDRRERLTEDERRSLHRDLDKANRELYGRRFQK